MSLNTLCIICAISNLFAHILKLILIFRGKVRVQAVHFCKETDRVVYLRYPYGRPYGCKLHMWLSTFFLTDAEGCTGNDIMTSPLYISLHILFIVSMGDILRDVHPKFKGNRSARY